MSNKQDFELIWSMVPTDTTTVAVCELGAGNGTFRVMLAGHNAVYNIQPWRGQPAVVYHAKGMGTWHVLSVPWQLRYALANLFDSVQDASHAFERMEVPLEDLPAAVSADVLVEEIATCVAINSNTRLVLKSVVKARTALTDKLLESLVPILDIED